MSKSVLTMSAVALLLFACRRSPAVRRSWFIASIAFVLAGVAAMNAITSYFLLATNRVATGFPVPLSSLICFGML